MDRIRFVTHRDQRILLLDFTGCSAEEVAAMADRVPEMVTREPLGFRAGAGRLQRCGVHVVTPWSASRLPPRSIGRTSNVRLGSSRENLPKALVRFHPQFFRPRDSCLRHTRRSDGLSGELNRQDSGSRKTKASAQRRRPANSSRSTTLARLGAGSGWRMRRRVPLAAPALT